MKFRNAVQEGCGYKDTLGAHRYFAPSAKYFTVCITYQPPLVHKKNSKIHLDRLQNKYTNCKGVKNNSNFGQITGIQEKLDTTCKQSAS